MIVLATFGLSAQTIYEYSRDDADLYFFSKGLEQNVPHIIRNYEVAKSIHGSIWKLDTIGKGAFPSPMIMVRDWCDDGNAGAGIIPFDFISIDVAPTNYSYYRTPNVERYHSSMCHEYTHIVASEKTAGSDRFWKSVLGGRFNVESQHPFSALWSFLVAPRWYTPRWYQEGIACFMQTWLNGGVGRSMGGYDEMYFRSIVDSEDDLYSVVGLEAEGTASDFQSGNNSYLYGTRFVNYLVYKYGLQKLLDFYDRSENSKKLFNHQFEAVYGESLRKVWDDWRTYEVEHQTEQFKRLEEYPVTPMKLLSDKALGSMSPIVFDDQNNCFYTAVNYPGDFAHIERYDLSTLESKKLTTIDNPMAHQTSYLALDKNHQRLIWTTQNNKYRGLRVYDIKEDKIVKKLNYQRVYNIVYDNATDRLYGVFTSQGRHYLIRYDSNLENKEVLYSFPFGVSVFDIDVSHDGKMVSVTTSEESGGQSLLCFDVENLENADFSFRTIYSAEDFNLGQFRFAPGDSVMVGSSYYTGVSNIWSIDLKTKELSLLSNARIGLFAPLMVNDSTMLANAFERNGMRPVEFYPKKLNDVNSIELLGQKAYEAHPEELEALNDNNVKVPVKKITYSEVVDSIKIYNPLKNLRFTGAYPEISGFKDKEAWNNVTPVLGYRFTFMDRLALNKLSISIGISPWSHNKAVNQYHFQLDWKYKWWNVRAAWNPTSFYDLVGPVQSSRKGWMVDVGYDRTRSLLPPVTRKYGAHITAYGMMDALPLYQEIETEDITSFQTANAYYAYSKTRTSLGGVTPEQGIVTGVDAYTYLADWKFYPTVIGKFDAGFLIPGIKNTCVWFRTAVGQNFGDRESIFGNEYFGGFGNNWVDYREANRYRSVSRFAGKKIDAIKAHSFARLMAEVSFTPIRYNNFGFINLYPTYSQFNLFSTGLLANPWEQGRAGYVNVGIQLNNEVVLFKFLKTTWSIGYAHAFNPDGTSEGDWLFSLKLL